MKKSDIAMLVLIAGLSVMAAFLIASTLPFLTVDRTNTKVPTIEKISGEIRPEDMPDPDIFNKKAINPTVKTVIGDK